MAERILKRDAGEIGDFCPYLEKAVSDGLCYDMQMIAASCIKPSALPEIGIDKERLRPLCAVCDRSLKDV